MFRSRTQLPAENLFLRKQLAHYIERKGGTGTRGYGSDATTLRGHLYVIELLDRTLHGEPNTRCPTDSPVVP